MMVFSTFLFVFLDWAAMWHCQDVQCKKIPIIRDDVWTLNAFHVIVLLFELVVFFYWFSLVVKYGKDVLSMIAIKNFYNYDLNISEQDIQTIQWNEVVEKIIELQHKRKIYIVKNIDEFGTYVDSMTQNQLTNFRHSQPYHEKRKLFDFTNQQGNYESENSLLPTNLSIRIIDL